VREDLKAAVGRFATPNASRYLQQLCKHFGHKVEVEFDAWRGVAALPPGPARMHATDTELTVTVTGRNPDEITRAKGIIDSHLARFAFREDFQTMDWG
jgi:uncharacterized protein